MKNIFFFILIITVFSSNLFSQTEKRNLMLGGNMNLNIARNSSYCNIHPNFGVFVKNNFLLGLNPSFSFARKLAVMGLRVHSRLFFLKKEKTSFYGLTAFGLFDLTSNVVPTHRSAYVSAGVGHTWFLRKNIGFEANLLGSYNKFEDNSRLFLNFGFQIYLDRKPKIQSK